MSFLRRHFVAFAIFALAAVLRFLWLDARPPHFDEGVNGWFTDQMLRNGCFRYDPTNYHGPLHFYALFLCKVLFGRNLWALRVPTVLAGLATIAVLLWRLPRFTSLATARIAALGVAVSPVYLFYHRDAIHEPWLGLFIALGLVGLLGVWQTRTKTDLWLLVAGISGMILTKETYVIHIGSALLAWACAAAWSLVAPQELPAREAERGFTWLEVAQATAIGAAVIVFFYSGNFFHFEDLRGLYATFGTWVKTGATNKGHAKEWYHWFLLLGRYEWLSVLGVAAAIRFLFPGADARWRWLAITALGTLTAYSIIPYKTPWCMLAIAGPFIVLAAVAAGELVRLRQPSYGAAALTVVMIALVHDAHFATRLSWREYTNEDEPYIYVQTSDLLANFTEPILDLARADARNYHLRGYIVGESAYPVPWLLGDFPRVGYYRGKRALPEERPDFLLVTTARLAEVETRLDEPYFKERMLVHPAFPTAYTFMRASVFGLLFEGREPEFVPGRVEPTEEPAKEADEEPEAEP